MTSLYCILNTKKMETHFVECANRVHVMTLGSSYLDTTPYEKILRDSLERLYDLKIRKNENETVKILSADITTKTWSENDRENGYKMRVNLFVNKLTNKLQFSFELWFNETRVYTYSRDPLLDMTPEEDYSLLTKYTHVMFRILDVVDYAYFLKTARGKKEYYNVEICPLNRETFITSQNKLFAIKVTYKPTNQKLTFIHVIESGGSLLGDDFLILNNESYKQICTTKGIPQSSNKVIRLFNVSEEEDGWYTHVKKCVSYIMLLFES